VHDPDISSSANPSRVRPAPRRADARYSSTFARAARPSSSARTSSSRRRSSATRSA
jgi:hypothetical protein